MPKRAKAMSPRPAQAASMSPEEAEALRLQAFKDQPLENKVKFLYENLALATFGHRLVKCRQTSNVTQKNGDLAKAEGHFTRAMKWYSQSLAHAPKNDHEMQATVHLKRAKVLILLKKYNIARMELDRGIPQQERTEKALYEELRNWWSECLTELEMKMKSLSGRAREEWRNLIRRRGSRSEAEDISENSDSTSDNRRLDEDADSLVEELGEEEPAIEHSEWDGLYFYYDVPGDILRSEFGDKNRSSNLDNRRIAGISNRLTIRETSATSNKVEMIANKAIWAGDLLMTLKPYASVLDDSIYSNCWHCSMPSVLLIPCENCPLVMYCGEKCRYLSFTAYHRMECKFMSHLREKNRTHQEILAMKILMIATEQGNALNRLMNHPVFRDPFTKARIDWSKKMNSNDYELIHALDPKIEVQKDEYVMEMARRAAHLLWVLKHPKVAYFPSTAPGQALTEAEIFVGNLLLKLLLVVDAHRLPIIESPGNLSCNTSIPSSYNRQVGFALYPIINTDYIEHSCDPNMFCLNYKNILLVYSYSPILPNEKVTIGYFGADCVSVPKETRMRLLKPWHTVQCDSSECKPCRENWNPYHYDLFGTIDFVDIESVVPSDEPVREIRVSYERIRDRLESHLLERFQQHLDEATEEMARNEEHKELQFIRHRLKCLRDMNKIKPWKEYLLGQHYIAEIMKLRVRRELLSFGEDIQQLCVLD